MIIDCALYRDGRRQQEAVLTLDQAATLHRDGSDGFAWLGTFEPGPEELERIRDSFGLHELAVEDVKSFHLRPKVEQYGQDVELVILRTARYDDDREEVDFGEISVFIAPTFVITVRQGVASELHRRAPTSRRTRRCWRRAARRSSGPSSTRSSRATVPSSPSWSGTSRRWRAPASPAKWHRRSGSTSCAARSPTSTAPSTRC